MNRLLISTIAALATMPAMAHEIAETHAHIGDVVLMELPQAAFFVLGALVLVSVAFVVRAKLTKRAKK